MPTFASAFDRSLQSSRHGRSDRSATACSITGALKRLLVLRIQRAQASRPERIACIVRRRSQDRCLVVVASRIAGLSRSRHFQHMGDLMTHMDRPASPSSRGCSCLAIEACCRPPLAGLMMPAGRIALQICAGRRTFILGVVLSVARQSSSNRTGRCFCCCPVDTVCELFV